MLVQVIIPSQQWLNPQVRKLVLLLALVVCNLFQTNAQKSNFRSELNFVNYLINKHMYQEASFSLNTIDSLNLQQVQLDSLNFYKGLAAFTLNNHSNALERFNKISIQSVFYYKALVTNSYLQSTLRNYSTASILLNKAKYCNDSLIGATAHLLIMGNALLSDSIHTYLAYRKIIDTTNPVINSACLNIDKAYQFKLSNKKKSVLAGALLSAFVPGLGKCYANKPTEAIGAFIPVVSLGYLAAESYNKAGIKSVGFLSFASLFTIFYLGNIWGSASAIKIRNTNIVINYENKISNNMLITVKSLLY